MIRWTKSIALTMPWLALPLAVLGQSPPPTILAIDVENVVEYQGDIYDPTKFGTSSGVTPSGGSYTFAASVAVGDIVSVNGEACSGTYIGRPLGVFLSPTPKPKQSIADISRGSLRSHTFEILKTDGTPIGTLLSFGLDGGSPPPGAPSYSAATKGNYTIYGGTGAYLGARGELVQKQQALETVPPRAASLAEDPSNRRINGGGTIHFFLHVIPMATPQIADTPQGPAVTHSSDFTPVSASKPAAAGEVLSLFATGLGPTLPGVDPGQPFPASPLQAVNSPVQVMVNGESAEVLGAAGFPGATDGYQVNFRLPADTAKGPAGIQLNSAWIAGAPVTIAVQ